MNDYLKNLRRIEFVVTFACTGRCRHCSEGDHSDASEHIDAEAAVEAVRSICGSYQITSLMTFGGEALLYPDVVCTIHRAAADLNIGKRQVITNGFFSKKQETIEETVRKLADSGVNHLLLSVDAFHQETIPLEPVMFFAECAVKNRIPIRLQPAWLVSADNPNPYNLRTKEIIRCFDPLQIPLNSGNVIFPSGNALKYLSAYFDGSRSISSPYDEDPEDVHTISFLPNGDVLNGNVYREDILSIMKAYRP